MAETRLSPGDTIGILGGGQLGRMLAMAAARLGLRCHIYCDDPNAPAFAVAEAASAADYTDQSALTDFSRNVDVATFEFENVPTEALLAIAKHTQVHPSPDVLAVSQDRLAEKDFLTKNGIAVAPYHAVDSSDDLNIAIEVVGLPAILKTRRFGYDGKGQLKIFERTQVSEAAELIENNPALLEAHIDFLREVSVVLARDLDGNMRTYDLCENLHQDQILRKTLVPAATAQQIHQSAIEIAQTIAQQLQFVGVLCVEFFECADDRGGHLLVNELAPRVHNSGHWTLDACLVSQFENHIRAIAGWPLGTTERHSNVEMTNLIGDDAYDWNDWLAKDTAFHLYGKPEVRAGRKMGHVTKLFPKKAGP